MIINRNDAFPSFVVDPDGMQEPFFTVGLSKREYFAGLAMQGMLSNQYVSDFNGSPADRNDELAYKAVHYADALLKALGEDK